MKESQKKKNKKKKKKKKKKQTSSLRLQSSVLTELETRIQDHKLLVMGTGTMLS